MEATKKDKGNGRERLRRYVLILPERQYQQLRAQAYVEHKKMAEVLREALESHLGKKQKQAAAAARG